MPAIPNIPQLQKPYLNGLIEEFSRESRMYPLERWCPAQAYPGRQWSIDVVTSGRGRGVVKALGAATRSVQRDAARQLNVSPFHFGENVPILPEDMDVLRRPGGDAELDKARIVAGYVQKLLHRWRALRQFLTAGMLSSGALAVNENGVVANINYGIPALTPPPGGSWAINAATIVQDVAFWVSEFLATNGVMPNRVFYDPTVINPYLFQNTEVQAWAANIRGETVATLLANMMDPQGQPRPVPFLGGLQWEPITANYETTDLDPTTQTQIWTADMLAFVADPLPGETVMEFRQSRDEATDQTGGPVSDSIALDEPKGSGFVRLHANGIPTIRQTQRIMLVDVTP